MLNIYLPPIIWTTNKHPAFTSRPVPVFLSLKKLGCWKKKKKIDSWRVSDFKIPHLLRRRTLDFVPFLLHQNCIRKQFLPSPRTEGKTHKRRCNNQSVHTQRLFIEMHTEHHTPLFKPRRFRKRTTKLTRVLLKETEEPSIPTALSEP